ncbi:hypothetical protein AXX12_08545 [Anaerosporomusa subterranea]|uniref:DUF1659 domain-containing protein n=1 Tax=Anaerosporomusa subterranea TaxID=1794912 RepID=A0A154BRB7_ANASB|nr:DUF1659 domain-containing protein [Anaerosporomusa subterranea]KYZ76471.1 hypothetical protein AXX12_08545 [Anaerosporomusa subterranea]
MAIVNMPQAARLQIKVQTGLNASGAPVYRVRSLQNLKNGTVDDSVYAVAQGLASLQQHTVVAISRQDDANLIDQ